MREVCSSNKSFQRQNPSIRIPDWFKVTIEWENGQYCSLRLQIG